MMAQTGSVYLTVCVTLERYVAVCRPLRAKSLCTYGRYMYLYFFVLFKFIFTDTLVTKLSVFALSFEIEMPL